MFPNRLLTSVVGTAALTAVTLSANAQFYSGSNACNSCAPIAQTTALPSYQTCYQTVPVTHYEREVRSVRRPVVKTDYVDEEVTVYKPVSEARTAEVPTVRYENVTEYKTVTRDAGRWTTQYTPRPRVAPCQYDSRPGMAGWFGRTSYSMRTAFQPRYTTSRQYVPKMCVAQVPVTRQVAIRGTRQVSYQVTKMVAQKETRRVARNRVTYVDDEVTVMKPVTAYRTVPTGTSVAYGGPYGQRQVAFYPGSTATAFGVPVIQESRSRSASLEPQPDDKFRRRTTDSSSDPASSTKPFDADLNDEDDGRYQRKTKAGPASFRREVYEDVNPKSDSSFNLEPSTSIQDSRRVETSRRTAFVPVEKASSVIRTAGWRRTRSRDSIDTPGAYDGPVLTLVSDR